MHSAIAGGCAALSTTPMETCASQDVEGGTNAAAKETAALADFTCPVCMDLLYKPCVNNCGHAFCFWCMHHAMNPFRPSQCPLCRSPYTHFPRVCLPLHYFLEATFPEQYAERRRENKELEAQQGVESPDIPQLPTTPQQTDAGPAGSASTHDEADTTPARTCAVAGSETTAAAVQEVARPYRCSNSACGRPAFQPCVLSCGCVVCGRCASSLQPKEPPPGNEQLVEPEQGQPQQLQLHEAHNKSLQQEEHHPEKAQHQREQPVPPQQPQRQQQHGREPLRGLCPSCKRPCLPSPCVCLKLEEALRCLYDTQYQQLEEENQAAAAAAATAAERSAVRASSRESTTAAATASRDAVQDSERCCSPSTSASRGGSGSGDRTAGGQGQEPQRQQHQQRQGPGTGLEPQAQQGGEHRVERPRSKLPRIDALIAAAATSRADAAAAASGAPPPPTIAAIWSALREEMAANADTCFTWYSVGCDDCGVFPIVGRRYRCRDCPEAIGYDLCGACFDRGTSGRGRFNQAHTPQHRMEKMQPWLCSAGRRSDGGGVASGSGGGGGGGGAGGQDRTGADGLRILTLMNYLEVLHPELTVEQATSLVLLHLGSIAFDLDALGLSFATGSGSSSSSGRSGSAFHVRGAGFPSLWGDGTRAAAAAAAARGGGGPRVAGALRYGTADGPGSSGHSELERAAAGSQSAMVTTSALVRSASGPVENGARASGGQDSTGGGRSWSGWSFTRLRRRVPEVAARQNSFSSLRRPRIAAAAASGSGVEGEARRQGSSAHQQHQRQPWLSRLRIGWTMHQGQGEQQRTSGGSIEESGASQDGESRLSNGCYVQ